MLKMQHCKAFWLLPVEIYDRLRIETDAVRKLLIRME